MRCFICFNYFLVVFGNSIILSEEVRLLQHTMISDCMSTDVAVGRVHDLHSMKQVAFLEAHDAEVLCLEFTRPESGKHSEL